MSPFREQRKTQAPGGGDAVWKPPLFVCEDYEKALLGALLIAGDVPRNSGSGITHFDEASNLVTPEMFYQPRHAALYESLQELRRRDLAVGDVTVLVNLMVEREQWEEWDGSDRPGYAWLADLMTGAYVPSNIPFYADRIRECARKRVALDRTTEMMQRLQDGEDVDAVKTWYDEKTSGDDSGKNDALTHYEIIREYLHHLDHPDESPPVPSGFASLDAMCDGGFRPGDFVVIAARPGMGKTAFAVNIATNMIRDGTPVYLFSMEMSRRAIIERLIASFGDIPLSDVKRPQGNYMCGLIAKTVKELAGLKDLIVSDRQGLTVADMETKTKQLVKQHGSGCVVVDYIGRIKSPNEKKLRPEQVAEISSDLKSLAGRLECPVIALSQINREVGNEKDKRPKMHFLRDSGAIEQDADMVLMLHREHYYDEDADKQKAELIVTKNRNGRCGTVDLCWQGEIVRFTEINTGQGYYATRSDYSQLPDASKWTG